MDAPPSGARLRVITAALMLSLFLAATETTFIAAAMPTIAGQLGGLSIYSWVFAGFMLSSTVSVPVFGKLSDLYGRPRLYLVAMFIFLVGSILCGLAQNMVELVIFRILQGIGAGGLMPLVFTIIGDVYSFEQRARVQGLFASVWGISSILGPITGGFLVDQMSWRWVFLLNVPPGLAAALVMWIIWRDVSPRNAGRMDYAGTALLIGSIVALMLALFQLRSAASWRSVGTWALVGTAVVFGGALWHVERRTANPILPIDLFRERLFAAACGHSFGCGFAVFGSLTFIPLFVQLLFQAGATGAGASMMPLLLTWVVASSVGSRLLLRFAFRSVALCGATVLLVGLYGMSGIHSGMSRGLFVVYGSLIGLGMGLSMPVFLIAVQTSMPKRLLGTATSTVQFCRSIGGAIGVSIMGAILSFHVGSGFDAADARVRQGTVVAQAAELSPTLREALEGAARDVFCAALFAGILAWGFTALAPRSRLRNRGIESPRPELAIAGEPNLGVRTSQQL